jgi:hypothetical protein
MDGETRQLPEFFVGHARKDLGRFWDALPPDALAHDPYAYLNGERQTAELTAA